MIVRDSWSSNSKLTSALILLQILLGQADAACTEFFLSTSHLQASHLQTLTHVCCSLRLIVFPEDKSIIRLDFDSPPKQAVGVLLKLLKLHGRLLLKLIKMHYNVFF